MSGQETREASPESVLLAFVPALKQLVGVVVSCVRRGGGSACLFGADLVKTPLVRWLPPPLVALAFLKRKLSRDILKGN